LRNKKLIETTASDFLAALSDENSERNLFYQLLWEILGLKNLSQSQQFFSGRIIKFFHFPHLLPGQTFNQLD
jgi:hypothetical protein